MKKIDLHTHTTASDGIKTPRELIDFALNNGVEVLAITDHDTIEGVSEALTYAADIDYTIIPGVEFSVDYPKGSFHLLGLYIDHTYVPLRNRIKELAEARATRGYRIIEDLQKHGISISNDELKAEAGESAIGRPHIARILVRKGLASDIHDTFSKFLVKGKPGYVKKDKIGLEEAISLITAAGGVPIIAHPVSLEFEDYADFEKMLPDFIKMGIRGIEVYAAMHSQTDINILLSLAETYNLLVSGGSDFHGDKDETIGCYYENTVIPYEIYEKLKLVGEHRL